MKKNSNDTEKIIRKIFEDFLSGSENPRRKEDGEIIIEEGLANYILCVPRFFYDMVSKMSREEAKRLVDRYGKIVKQIAQGNKEGILFCDESSRKGIKLEKSYDNITKILSSVKLPPNINIIDFLNLLKMTAREMQFSDDIEISDVNNLERSITNSRTTVDSMSQNIINRVETALNLIYDIQEKAKRIEEEQKRADIAQRDKEAEMRRHAEKERYKGQKKPEHKTEEQILQEEADEYIRTELNGTDLESIIDFLFWIKKIEGKPFVKIAIEKVLHDYPIKREDLELYISTTPDSNDDKEKLCAQLKHLDGIFTRYTPGQFEDIKQLINDYKESIVRN